MEASRFIRALKRRYENGDIDIDKDKVQEG